MGNSRSSLSDLNLFSKGGVFTREQLDEYQDCTFFTKKDILRLYKRFYSLNPSKVPSNMQGNRPSIVTLCCKFHTKTLPSSLLIHFCPSFS